MNQGYSGIGPEGGKAIAAALEKNNTLENFRYVHCLAHSNILSTTQDGYSSEMFVFVLIYLPPFFSFFFLADSLVTKSDQMVAKLSLTCSK